MRQNLYELKLVKAHNVYFIVIFYPPCRMSGLTLSSRSYFYQVQKKGRFTSALKHIQVSSWKLMM